MSNPLNPEAGDVAAPAAPRVVAAIVRANDLSVRLVPYWRDRWGDRGVRFGLSDSGWIVTLVEHGETWADQNLSWLHGVLSNRGMPGWLLEVHLSLLARVLSRQAPGQDWAMLARVAGGMAARRLAILPEDRWEALTRGYLEASPLRGRRARGTASILLSGVADEAGGKPHAVDSLLEWFCDADRFGARGAATARDLVARGRLQVAPRK